MYKYKLEDYKRQRRRFNMEVLVEVFNGNNMTPVTVFEEGTHYVVHGGFCHLTSRVRLTVDGFSVTLPSRFKFSASIPKVFQWFIGKPTDEEFALAACIHDYLHKLRYDRDTTDEVFNILLSWQMLNTTKRLLMYYAVRVGGHAFYAARANNNKLSTRFWRWLVTRL